MLVITSNLLKPIWYLFGSLIAVGGIYALIRYFRKASPIKKPIDHLVLQENVTEPDHTVQDSVNPTTDTVENKEDFVVNEIISIIHYFKGFMNSLLDISKGLDSYGANTTFENLSQVIAGHGSSLLKEWFLNFEKDRKDWDEDIYKKKAGQILKIFRECGITPSTETKIKWNEDAEKHYKKFARIEQGEIVEVDAPCWIYKNSLFEQGIVKK